MADIEKLLSDAYKLFYEGKFSEALKLYYVILSENLNNSVSYYSVALTYEMLNEFELAVSYYKKSIRIDGNIRSVNNLARIYIDVIKDNNIAKEYLDFAIKNSPNDAEAYNLYANICVIEKDYKLAESYLKKSIFYDDKFFKNYFDIANVYYHLNDKKNAASMIAKCLELKSDFNPALELSKKIDVMTP